MAADEISSGVFGAVKGAVSCLNKRLLGILITGGHCGNADAERDVLMRGSSVWQIQRMNGLSKFFGDDVGARDGGVREQDDEFLSSITGSQVSRALHAVPDLVRHLTQAVVTGLVAVGVVIGFEVIDIAHEDGNLARPASGAAPFT